MKPSINQIQITQEKSVDWNIISSVTGIQWPALPAPVGAARLAVLFEIEQSQWWPEAKLRQYQYSQLRPLLKHCNEQVPYYKGMFKNLLSSNVMTDEQWLNIPLLTRNIVQANGDMLRANTMPPGHGALTKQFTSGSTGKPVEVLGTDITSFFWNVFCLRDSLWHQHDLNANMVVVRRTQDKLAVLPHGQHYDNWGRATNSVIKTGPSSMLSIFTPISELAVWLQKEQPDYLLTNPSVLQDLALYCQRENIKFPTLRQVHTISEALPDGLRALCKEVWGVSLVDVYSSIELGYLALQCPQNEHYHIQSEGVLIEILNDDGRPCAPGEVGRVIVTNLHNYATPLIRYELGDYAEVGEPCSCGRGLPVIKRIQGRYRGMVTLPSGERSWPDLGLVKLNKIAPIQQFQVIQHSLQDIEVTLVLPRPIQPDERANLIALFHHTLRYPFNIVINQVAEIPRSVGGKYEEFISRLGCSPVVR
jgi:phenylacetate-CoA ligase